MRKVDRFRDFQPLSRAEWRAWLAENFDKSEGVWFVYYKKHTGKPRVSYDDAVEEALCFGWIDGLARGLDDERSKLLFTPRKPKSVWSKPNKARVEKIIAEGIITEAGLAKIEAAKRDGSWNALNSIDNLEIPPDLAKELKANQTAAEYFEKFPDSVKKGILYWISSAKRDETRRVRIEKTISMAARNKRANFDKE